MSNPLNILAEKKGRYIIRVASVLGKRLTKMSFTANIDEQLRMWLIKSAFFANLVKQ